MTLLWAKEGVAVDERIQRFLAAEDAILDRQLLLFDIQASRAHTRGLQTIGVLTQEEATEILRELDALAEAFQSGEFILDETFEDGHSAIETWLTEKLGPTGKKVHTGRSRNDQVQVALRLFLVDALQTLEASCVQSASNFLERAKQDADLPMPGYTHLQRAVPSSAGMWFAGFAEAFIDNAQLARMTRTWLKSNPLGSAAGYGVNLPLDREGVTQDLHMDRTQLNPQYVQNSRGRFELQALMALFQSLLEARRFAWDLSLYTTSEFNFVQLPALYTTGSSIMPNKRNPDVVELLRASCSTTQGAMAEIQAILSLPSGYHRDLQATKPPVLRALRHGLEALGLLPGLIDAISFNQETLRDAISPEMYATDRAVELATDGVPFRDAYKQVASELDQLSDRSPEDSLKARTSPGAPGNLQLEALQARLDALQK